MQRLIAEMCGFSDEQEAVHCSGKALDAISFLLSLPIADYVNGIGQKAFIAELMSKHPLYIDFLSEDAQEVIGEVHPQTVPSRRVRELEGLDYQGYVDIFDSWETLEAEIDKMRAVKQRRLVKVALIEISIYLDAPSLLVDNDN